jgi:PIN domain nuclease of toxin-antitoxin system
MLRLSSPSFTSNREAKSWKAQFQGAVMCAVYLSEVAAKLAEEGMPEAAVQEMLSYIELDIRPFGSADALQSSMLRPLTRDLGLSLGARGCLALGIQRAPSQA